MALGVGRAAPAEGKAYCHRGSATVSTRREGQEHLQGKEPHPELKLAAAPRGVSLTRRRGLHCGELAELDKLRKNNQARQCCVRGTDRFVPDSLEACQPTSRPTELGRTVYVALDGG